MRKTMICINAPTNTGKTTTVKKVHELLGGKAEVRNSDNDFVDVLKYEGAIIGCESEGDPPGENQKEALEHLMGAERCDIVIGASRTRGRTAETARDLSEKYKYEFIRFTPAFVYDPLNGNADDVYTVFAQKNAEIVMDLVHKIINGEI